jgi:hypothetical protein
MIYFTQSFLLNFVTVVNHFRPPLCIRKVITGMESLLLIPLLNNCPGADSFTYVLMGFLLIWDEVELEPKVG